MVNKKYFILSLVTLILALIEAIEVRDLTYDPNSSEKIGQTDENGLFLIDVDPTKEGYLLELRDPKGIYENANIHGDSKPKKQRKSQKLVSKQAVKEWDDKRVKQEIEQQVSKYSVIRNNFPSKKTWHKAVRRLVNENLGFLEENLKPEIRSLVIRDILDAREEIKK